MHMRTRSNFHFNLLSWGLAVLLVIIMTGYGYAAETESGAAGEKIPLSSDGIMIESGRTYTISSLEELENLVTIVRERSDSCKGAIFELTADIVINEGTFGYDPENRYAPLYNGKPVSKENMPKEWSPIGGHPSCFPSGAVFDGKGHSVSGIFVDKPSGGPNGLFGTCYGTIQNVTVKNSYINSNMSGGICGRLYYNGKILNCESSAMIFGTSTHGGIVGQAEAFHDGQTPTVENCVNRGIIQGSDRGMLNVTETHFLGGIVGHGQQARIVNCVNYGSIDGTSYVGSIVGGIHQSEVIGCTNYGKATMGGYEAGQIGVKDAYTLAPGYHAHDFGTKYVTSEKYHWKECACGEQQFYGPHRFTKPISISATQTQKYCEICRYTVIETISKPDKPGGSDGTGQDNPLDKPNNPDHPNNHDDPTADPGQEPDHTGANAEPSPQKIKEGVQKTTIKAKTVDVVGNVIRVCWKKSAGYKVDYFQVFRSVKKNSGYGKKAFYTTKTGKATYYTNTKNLKKGTRYYYKVRGVRVVNGKKVYTKWSNVAYRKAK